MTTAIPLRHMLHSGRRLVGTLVTTDSGAVAQALAFSGWDWLLIDLEHSPLGVSDAQRILQAIGGRCHSVIRVPDRSETAIKQALDTGCSGIIVPQVNDAGQARDVVRAARYPPAGARSVGIARAHRYGTGFAGYIGNANDTIAVVVQAEHVDAVHNINDILAVDGIDAVFIGPYDLSGSLGVIGQVDDPRVTACIGTVQQACRDHEVAWGIFGLTPAGVEASVAAGATLIAIGSDISMMMTASQAACRAVAPDSVQPQFRRIADGDDSAVHRLHTEALQSTDALITVEGYYADLDDIRGHYIVPGGEFLVGEVGGAIVAMGGVTIHPGNVAELRRMRVAPGVQGRGSGEGCSRSSKRQRCCEAVRRSSSIPRSTRRRRNDCSRRLAMSKRVATARADRSNRSSTSRRCSRCLRPDTSRHVRRRRAQTDAEHPSRPSGFDRRMAQLAVERCSPLVGVIGPNADDPAATSWTSRW